MIKGIIYQENIIILNIHILSIDIPDFITQTLLYIKSYINPNIVMEGGRKMNTETLELNDIIDPKDLMDIYSSLKCYKMHILLSNPKTHSRIAHILGHKAGFHKDRKMEVIFCILFDYNEIKLEITKREMREDI